MSKVEPDEKAAVTAHPWKADFAPFPDGVPVLLEIGTSPLGIPVTY